MGCRKERRDDKVKLEKDREVLSNVHPVLPMTVKSVVDEHNRVVHGSHSWAIFGSFSNSFLGHF
jgi:hypothetical protein